MTEPNDRVRVRFAPSPTGHLHVGGARTALFNWLYARHHGGTFILRIEDTDQSRSTDENIDLIVDALRWLGLDWDEGPPTPGYRQTERYDLYREHAARLVAAGRAYYCDCAPAQLDARAQGGRGRARRRSGTPGAAATAASPPGALRLRIPPTGTTVVHDLINGPVEFDHRQLDDWILLRTDGSPTYNFCVVVDDVTMRISHVIRGNDHLSNTPKQVLCYEALDYPVPAFAHVSMILGADRARLSKRHGATSVQAYREQGILPEALVNYLVRLGWSHGDQEIFTRAELIERFDIKDVSASAAIFDQAKLEWLSQEYLKATDGAAPGHARPARSWPRPDCRCRRRAPAAGHAADAARARQDAARAGRGRAASTSSGPAATRTRPGSKLFTPEGATRLDVLIERLADAGAVRGRRPSRGSIASSRRRWGSSWWISPSSRAWR